jgi:hypothetical protein
MADPSIASTSAFVSSAALSERSDSRLKQLVAGNPKEIRDLIEVVDLQFVALAG